MVRTPVLSRLTVKNSQHSIVVPKTDNMSPSPSGLDVGPIPDLATTYSGVPQRLAQEAVAAKQRLFSQKTLPDSVARRRAAALPVGMSSDAFERAIGELKGALGENNVEINDKPLVDGWYMEHPYVSLRLDITPPGGVSL